MVSYNRRATLDRVIDGIRAQSRPVHRIVVVDNGSTDGSRDYLTEQAASDERLLVVLSAENSGGAGGFALGLAWAIEGGHDHAWLMDDDAIPAPGCLESLLEPFLEPGGERTVLSYPRVLDEGGATADRSYPTISRDFVDVYRKVDQRRLPIISSPFVGPLISLDAARRTHLPLKEFFIWHDDVEYTARICAQGAGLSIPDATIVHLAKQSGPEEFNRNRVFFNVRNQIWLYRESRRTTTAYSSGFLLVLVWRTLLSQLRHARRHPRALGIIARAVWQGVTRRQRHRMAAEVVAESRGRDRIVGAGVHS